MKNGDGWKMVSVGLAFLVQLVAIVWGLSSMNSKINSLTPLRPIVESVNTRLIRVETQISTINRDLEDCRNHIAEDRGGGGKENGS